MVDVFFPSSSVSYNKNFKFKETQMNLSIDADPIFSQAGSIVQNMMPLIVVVAGLGLGFGW